MNELTLSLTPSVPLHRQIEKKLRLQIESGLLQPGAPLPSTSEFARQFGVHPLTLHKAMRRLKDEGLIDRTPRVGSFVSANATTSNIALIVGPDLKHETARFHRSLVQELERQSDSKWVMRIYDDFPTHHKEAPLGIDKLNAALGQDCGRIAFRGLLGVSIGYPPWQEVETLKGLPTAWFSVASAHSDLALDHGDFVRSAVEYCAARGCRRLAYIPIVSDGVWEERHRKAFTDAAREKGIEEIITHNFCQFDLDGFLDEYIAYRWARKVVDGWQQDGWPDGVVVGDDLLTRSVAMALQHVNSPNIKRPLLFTWANDTIRLRYGMPVVRYNIPVKECARQLHEVLELRMGGRDPAEKQVRIRGAVEEEE